MNIKDRILFEDNHVLVVNKKAGELVQGDKTGDTTLADHLKAYIKKKNIISQGQFTLVLFTG